MAEAPVVRTEINGYRNVVVRFSMVSDGSGLNAFKVYDATSGGTFGVTAPGGAVVYPGINTKLVGLDFDVQGMGAELLWEATSNEQIMAFGASPEDFNWRKFGGIRVPAGLVGATGSILVTTIGAAANATLMMVLYIRKNVPQS